MKLFGTIILISSLWIMENLKIFKTGDRRPFKTRDLKYRGFAFNISPMEKSIYYIRIKSKDDLSIPFEILTLKNFLLEEKDVMIVICSFLWGYFNHGFL